MNNSDIVSSLRSTIDGFTIEYPELGEEVIASEVMASLNAIEEESFPTLFESGITPDDSPVMRINGMQYVMDEDEGAFVYDPSVEGINWNVSSESTTDAMLSVQGLISKYMDIGWIPFSDDDDTSGNPEGQVTPPVVVGDMASYLVRIPIDEEGQPMRGLEKEPPGWMYFLSVRDAKISERVLAWVSKQTGGYFNVTDAARTGFLEFSSKYDPDQGFIGDSIDKTLELLDKGEDIVIAGSDWVSDTLGAIGSTLDDAFSSSEEKESDESSTAFDSQVGGLIGSSATTSARNTAGAKSSDYQIDKDLLKYDLAESIPVFKAMGIVL
jgi:hypothetical protein